jgi:hypothetical protein
MFVLGERSTQQTGKINWSLSISLKIKSGVMVARSFWSFLTWIFLQCAMSGTLSIVCH